MTTGNPALIAGGLQSYPNEKALVHGVFLDASGLLGTGSWEEIVRQGKFDPLGVRLLPPLIWHPGVTNLREVVAAALDAQQYDGRNAWGFKDAKLALTWRVWHQHFPGARWIIVRRPDDEIIAWLPGASACWSNSSTSSG